MKEKEKRKIPINRLVVVLIVVQALVLGAGFLAIAAHYLQMTMKEIYNGVKWAVTGMVISAVDEEDLSALARETMLAYESMDDPIALYESDPDAYFAAFEGVRNSPLMQKTKKTSAEIERNSLASGISFVIILPDENKTINVIDFYDPSIACGTFIELETSRDFVPGKAFQGYTEHYLEDEDLLVDGFPCFSDDAKDLFSYLIVQVPVDALQQKIIAFVLNVGGMILGFMILAGLLAVYLLRKDVTAPLERIVKASEKLAKNYGKNMADEEDVFGSVAAGRIEELANLKDSLQEMEKDMRQSVNDILELSLEKERISTELELAQGIQSSMVPNTFPAFPDHPEFELFALMNPAREVGGDFYDYFLIDETHLALVIADVSDKGIPAALFMMMTKILTANYAMELPSPSEVLSKLNQTICANNPNDMFVTMWLGVLDLSTGVMKACNAGHEFPILRKAGQSYEYLHDRHGIAVGCMKNPKYADYEILLSEGDTLFVYTDGLPEAMNPERESYGSQRILDAMNSEPDASLEDLFAIICESVAEFVKNAPQSDDFTMAVLRLNAIGGPQGGKEEGSRKLPAGQEAEQD